MKNNLKIFIIFLLICTAFWAGYWISHIIVDEKQSFVGKFEPATANENPEEDISPNSPGTVAITPEKLQKIGVRVAVVEKKPVTHIIRGLGRVETEDNKI